MNNVEEVTSLYFEQYQKDSVSERALLAYREIADALLSFSHTLPSSALDVGSGGGALVRALIDRGVDAWGVEGSRHAVKLFPDRIHLHDLRQSYSLPWDDRRFPFVTSFDVAEHIEEEFANELCELIDRSSSDKNAILYFGAAPPGQGGLGHVNLQEPVYWIEKFQGHGFIYNEQVTTAIRNAINAEPNTNFIWWVSKNLLAFSR